MVRVLFVGSVVSSTKVCFRNKQTTGVLFQELQIVWCAFVSKTQNIKKARHFFFCPGQMKWNEEKAIAFFLCHE